MKRWLYLVPLTLLPQIVLALNPHPRIWLSPTLISAITAKKNANDADWLALKARADTYKTYTVAGYSRNTCMGNTICYSYQGSGWYDAMVTLALAYQVTGDATYAAKAQDLLTAMNAPYVASGDISPTTLDSGYPTRFVLPALAIAYDWLYSYLNATTKTNTINHINALYTWFSTGAAPAAYVSQVYGNYWGGHVLGFGLAAVATDGDNGTASTIYSHVRGMLDAGMANALAPGVGGFVGGGVPESYNYGANHNLRIWQLLLAWNTSGQGDLVTGVYADWLKASVKNAIYTLRPNLWQAGDEGDMAGDCTGVMQWNYPLLLAHLLNGVSEGAWAEYMSRNMATNPCNGATLTALDAVLWKDASRTSTNYTSTLPLNYFSPGDGHLLSRTDWTTGAVFLSFTASGALFTDHQNKSAGNLEVQRGNDYLLVSAAQWKTLAGYGNGNPSIFATAAQYASTLYFDDGGAYQYTGSNYLGGQGAWGSTKVLAHLESANSSYALADLGEAYDKRNDSRVPSNRTARYYYRSVAHVGAAIFVWDRFKSKTAAYTKRLQWHLNPANAPTVNGSVISTVKGSSKLFIDTLLPASPSIVTARDIATSDGTSPLTYNMQVSDSATGTDLNALTVIYATASNGSLPPTSTITTDADWVGAQVSDSTPLVAVFAKTVQDNGNNTYTPLTYAFTSFTSTHAGTGKYLVAGLQSGTYSVRRNGVALPGYSSVAVGADGTLFFTASAGAFSVVQSTTTISPCDLNGDGAANVLDVQIATTQVLAVSTCGNADLDQNGVCNLVDVQRLINAAIEQTCRVGP